MPEDILNFHAGIQLVTSVGYHTHSRVHNSMYYTLISDITSSEVGCSVITLIKSKHCMKINVEQEMRMAVFIFLSKSEKLYSV